MPVLRYEQLWNLSIVERDFLDRSQHLGDAFGQEVAILAGHGRFQHDPVVRQLLADTDFHAQLVAQIRPVLEFQVLRLIDRPRARKDVPQHRRDQRAHPHGRGGPLPVIRQLSGLRLPDARANM